MSNLASKAVLTNALEDFASDAHTAGRGLQRLSAKMRIAINSIASFNLHALCTITEAQAKGLEEADMTLHRTFQVSMDRLSLQIMHVIAEATTTTTDLDRLEDRLFEIRSLWFTEVITTNVELHDLLWKIWTRTNYGTFVTVHTC
ncbi:hypothetical protein L226DRAFT_576885 [Lentinus tigrinus ALCF2SS1-7]|uniref:uncharacterized protein n=1 Tax=Lentinus tigrinus ALCF2SS1-7 TaxID=1328758 RepID=UPI001165F8D8|nr:hypothetical protein L226DRAFT_576885 [Lentinus tigrinus ALCF2SS1-7]